MEEKTYSEDELEKHVDYIVNVLDSIEFGKCTLLVGFNGCGKSLIRKQMMYKVKKIGSDVKTKHVSMQLRTESIAELGALSTIMHDTPWSPTSLNTYDLINKLFGSLKDNKEKKDYIIIDEPEIGMSQESQLGIAYYLKENIPKVLEKTHGILIITHSNIIIETLKSISNFINIDKDYVKRTADEWLNTPREVTDFEDLERWSSSLYDYVEKRAGRKNKV